jgi:isopentenyl diphosphate isomerase/L-lactate dehydrogenase-like FMN-dependent dehydrogenase
MSEAREFAGFVRQQLRSDLRSLPARVRGFRAPEWRLNRANSLEDLRTMARASLPRAVFDFVDGAANDEVALARNRQDFQDLRIYPRVLVDVSSIDLTTSVLGMPIALPVIGAPTGLTGLAHHRGEIAVARALQAAGSLYVLSTMASYSIDEVAADAPGPKWFQLYVWKDRGLVTDMLQRAQAGAYQALVMTVDCARAGKRERDYRNGFSIPPRMTMRSLAGGMCHPRWSIEFVRHARFKLANMPVSDSAPEAVTLTRFNAQQFDASVTWETVEWVRERWGGPLVIKGIMDPADAAMATMAGADAVVVSNHGGRQFDDAPSSISALPAVVDAVAGSAEVYIDGGVRRGGDVLKALALGARACLVGRPFVFGLAVAGEAGVSRTIALLREELETAMALAGVTSMRDINASCLVGRQSVAERTVIRTGPIAQPSEDEFESERGHEHDRTGGR